MNDSDRFCIELTKDALDKDKDGVQMVHRGTGP